MAATRREIEIWINVETGKRVSSSGGIDPNKFILSRGTQIMWKVNLINTDLSTYALPSNVSLLFGIDDQFTIDHADLVLSHNDQFNVSGDWDNVSLPDGRFSARADLNTTELKASFSSDTPVKAEKDMWCCFWAQPAGGEYFLLSQFKVTMENVAVDPTSPAPTPEASYLTNDSFDAVLELAADGSVKLRNINGDVMQTWTI